MPLFARMRESIWSLVSPSSVVHKKKSRDAVKKRKMAPNFPNPAAVLPFASTSLPLTPSRQRRRPGASGPGTPASSSIPEANYVEDQTTSSGDSLEFPDYDDTLLVANETSDILDVSSYLPADESRKVLRAERKMHDEGWKPEEIDLYFELEARGTKPLFPDNWSFRDLPTLPSQLFADSRSEDDFFMIKHRHGEQFRALRAVCELIDLGPLVRDARNTKGCPERVIKRAVNAFHLWAVLDADLQHADQPLLFSVMSSSRTTSTKTMERVMRARLDKLARRCKALYRIEPNSDEDDDGQNEEFVPTVYGIMASHTAFAMVSYSLTRAENPLRTVGAFNFRDMTMDVWNSIAIMILIIHCRDKMIELDTLTSDVSS